MFIIKIQICPFCLITGRKDFLLYRKVYFPIQWGMQGEEAPADKGVSGCGAKTKGTNIKP